MSAPRPAPDPVDAPAARRLSAEDRREQLLAAAEALFTTRGFEGVGMNDIARALGTSRPTVYAYFTDTHGLLRALLDARLPRLWARLEPLLRDLAPGPNLYRAVFATLLRERELLLLLHSGGGPTFREERARLLTHLAGLIEPLRPPSTRSAPAQQTALHLITLLLESAALAALHDPPADADALGDAVADFLAGGAAALTGGRADRSREP